MIMDQIIRLLEVCGVKHDGTPSSIVAATQKAWLRQPGKERWEMEEKDFGAEKNQIIRDLAETLGFIREIPPKDRKYHYCLLHGCVLPQFQTEVNYAAKLWDRGVSFDKVVFLGGDRRLDPKADRIPHKHAFKTSLEGLRFVYEMTPLPDSMRALPLLIVNAPNPPGQLRPTTGDTIRAFLGLGDRPDSCLFVSRQPFVLYQDSVARSLMPPNCHLETVGPGLVKETAPIAIILDTIARYLFQQYS